jgi:transcriptional regulator with XRE-family HTH domain
MLGLSQGKLGKELDLTFQQVQKYERGTNRISASRLYHISKVLDVPINYFFEGLSSSFSTEGATVALAEPQTEYGHDPMARRETIDLVKSYYKINDPRVRRRIFELTKQLGKPFCG